MSEGTAPSIALTSFSRSTISLLRLWPAFQLILQHSTSTSASTQQADAVINELTTEIVSLFLDVSSSSTSSISTDVVPPIPEQDQIEALLFTYLDDEFQTSLEDGSEEMISKDLIDLWRESHLNAAAEDGSGAGVGEVTARIQRQTKAGRNHRPFQVEVQEEESTDGESDDDDQNEMDLDQGPVGTGTQRREKPEQVVDEEGFTLVQSSSKGRKGR